MTPEREAEAIEIRLFLEAIHARYGYDLREYAQNSITRRVLAALAKSGFRHLGELQHAVLHDSRLFAQVLEDLTVHVTDMFRDPAFYRAFRSRVVPILRTYPFIKLWHTGCATGEEVYSCAIMLAEEGLYERSQIYATDVSGMALEQAKQGVYETERLRTFAQNYADSGGSTDLSNYATEAYSHVAFREHLRKNVLFFQHDLVGDYVFGEMHVVFCRNVLMYFGKDLRDRVVSKFAQSLGPGGFLCLGIAENLPSDSRGSFNEFLREERVYRRTSAGVGS